MRKPDNIVEKIVSSCDFSEIPELLSFCDQSELDDVITEAVNNENKELLQIRMIVG